MRSSWIMAVTALVACVSVLAPMPTTAAEEPPTSVPADPLTVGAGGQTCALLDGGGPVCFGDNHLAQLGLGDTADRGATPGSMSDIAVDLGTGRTAVQVAAGASSTCAVFDDGTLKCWGISDFGQLGQGNTSTIGNAPGEMGDALPTIDIGRHTVNRVSVGGRHACAIRDDGRVTCWGRGLSGELGYGKKANIGDDLAETGRAEYVDFGDDRAAISIAAGFRHTCAVLEDGSVHCWGEGISGALGNGGRGNVGDSELTLPMSQAPVPLPEPATAVTAGDYHTCALLNSGSVICWGVGAYLGQGQIEAMGDDPGEVSTLDPIDLGTGRTATAVSAGSWSTCALLDDQSVKCWGDGLGGVLGQGGTNRIGDDDGEMGDELPPVDLGSGRRAEAVSVGSSVACALLDNATVTCWGAGGLLGTEDSVSRGSTPGSMGDALVPAALLGTVRATSATVSLTSDSPTATVGDVVDYELVLTNTGPRTLTDVHVTAESLPGCSGTPADLAPGSSTVLTCSSTAVAVGTIVRHATVTTGQFIGSEPFRATSNESTVVVSPVPVHRPDGLVRVGTKAFVGNSVYNTTADKQTVSSKVATGKRATYTVRVQNDGNVTDSYTVKGAKSTSKFTVKYVRGGQDVTKAVVAGTYEVTSLKKAGTADIRVTVAPTSKAAKASTLKVSVLFTSISTSATKDTVALITTRS